MLEVFNFENEKINAYINLFMLFVCIPGVISIYLMITRAEFVKKYKAEATRESLLLDYPSYILALAMGAGKTVLIGTIIATEFAMALEYPDEPFIKNALVFGACLRTRRRQGVGYEN